MIKEGDMVRFDKNFIHKYGNMYGATNDALKHIEKGNRLMGVTCVDYQRGLADVKLEEFCYCEINYTIPIKALQLPKRKLRRLE